MRKGKLFWPPIKKKKKVIVMIETNINSNWQQDTYMTVALLSS